MASRIAEISAKPFGTESDFRVFSILQTLRIATDNSPPNVHYSDKCAKSFFVNIDTNLAGLDLRSYDRIKHRLIAL